MFASTMDEEGMSVSEVCRFLKHLSEQDIRLVDLLSTALASAALLHSAAFSLFFYVMFVSLLRIFLKCFRKYFLTSS